MINKNYISEKIQEKFPELQRINFSINGNVLTDFSEKTLYPFMIYQNTVDTLNRLITVFLPESSDSALLTPFISAVGVYRKALEMVMQYHNYKNETFPNQAKPAFYNGKFCYIIQVDYINRLLVLREGRGVEHELSFENIHQLTCQSKACDILDNIENFKEIDRLSKKDIFTFPLVPSEEHYSGVILFTNVSKFETLLRSIKISDSDIREHLHIVKTSFDNDTDSIDFYEVSLKKTWDRPVSLIVSRSDSYRAFNNIIEAGEGDYDHVNTIIIDDFDEIILKAKKNNNVEETLRFLQQEYFEKLGKGIKDIFLLCSNRNFEVQEILTSHGISSFPWLLTPIEKLKLDTVSYAHPEICITNICNDNFQNILDQNSKLLVRWKELAVTNFCNGQIFLPIRALYKMREKWTSFFDPDNFNQKLLDFDSLLDQLQDDWFSNNIDYGLIKETKTFIKHITDHYKKNLLEPDIKKLIESADHNTNVIEIVTNNTDESDKKYFGHILKKINSKVDYIIKSKNDILLSTNSTLNIPDLIIYLTWDKELFHSSFINPLSRRQVYLINRLGYDFIKSYSGKINNRIKNIGNTENKYKLLNLESIEKTNPQEEELISLRFVEGEIKKVTVDPVDLVPEIEEFVHDIIVEHTRSIGSKDYITNTLMLFFEDGTHVEWPENKHVYFYDENMQSDNASLQKDINDLQVGDQIIVARRSKELRGVIEDTLSENATYAKMIKTDHEWRNKILRHIKINNWDYFYFRKNLKENGYKVDTDFTIINWIEGDTLQPHNFSKVLSSLCKMGVLSETKQKLYQKENSSLKSTKIKLIRHSVLKFLLSLKGIHYDTDGLLDETLLNTFISHIEIKRILGIIKK